MKPRSIVLSTDHIPKITISTHLLYMLFDLSRKSLGITLLELASPNQAGDFVLPHALDLVGDLEAVELTGQGGDLIGVNLALDELDVAAPGGPSDRALEATF